MTHLAPERINLAHDLPLGDTAHGRVARHLRNLVHVHSDEARLGPHPRGGSSGFTAGMSAANHNNIVMKIHFCRLLVCDKSKKNNRILSVLL